MPNFKKNASTFRMYGKSPMTKKLVGKQGNLPAELKAKIMAAPESPTKMYDKKSPAKKYKSDAMRKAVQGAKKGSAEYNAAQNKINKAYGKGPTNRSTTKVQKEVVKEATAGKMTKSKAKIKSKKELTNERIAARRAKRKEKLKKFVRGLGPRSKAKK